MLDKGRTYAVICRVREKKGLPLHFNIHKMESCTPIVEVFVCSILFFSRYQEACLSAMSKIVQRCIHAFVAGAKRIEEGVPFFKTEGVFCKGLERGATKLFSGDINAMRSKTVW